MKGYCDSCAGPHHSHVVERIKWCRSIPRRHWPPWLWFRFLWSDFVVHGLFGPSREFCQDCARPTPFIWRARGSLWEDVVGSSAGLLCPRCFNRRATEKGLLVVFFAEAT